MSRRTTAIHDPRVVAGFVGVVGRSATMKPLLSFLVGAGLSCLPSVSAAQGLFAAPDPRFRFGVAAGATLLRTRTMYEATPWLDATLDLGAQLNDRIALFAHGSFGWWGMSHRASTYAVIELTPVDRVSIGTGFGWDHLVENTTARCNPEYIDPVYFTCGHRVWNGWSVPLMVSLNLGGRGNEHTRRHGLRLSVEGALGVNPSNGEEMWRASVSLGYVAM